MSNVVWISSESAWRRRAGKRRSGRMSDPSFEARLGRLYAQPPAGPGAEGGARGSGRLSGRPFEAWGGRLSSQPPQVPDADGFAHRVQARLDREWSLRRG